MSLPRLDGHLRKVGPTSTGNEGWRRGSGAGSPPSTRVRRSSGWRRAARPCRRSPRSSGSTPTSSGAGATSTSRPARPRPWRGRRPRRPSWPGFGGRGSGSSRRTRSSRRPRLFSPGRRPSHEVPLRRRRACDVPGPDAVPDRGRRGERLLRLAPPRPGRRRRRRDDRRVSERIAAIFEASRRTYGSPRVHAELRAEGVRVGRKRGARLMREGGLTPARRRRRVPRTTDSRHDHPVAPNLLDRHFAADRPDAVWLADISYIPTGEGWLYLAAIKDMATREVVGWSMADHLRAELACDALRMALRRPLEPAQY